MRGWWLAAAMALGGVAGAGSCTDGATLEEACAVVCACDGLPSEQQQCEVMCRTQDQVPQECIECIVEVEECSRLGAECDEACE